MCVPYMHVGLSASTWYKVTHTTHIIYAKPQHRVTPNEHHNTISADKVKRANGQLSRAMVQPKKNKSYRFERENTVPLQKYLVLGTYKHRKWNHFKLDEHEKQPFVFATGGFWIVFWDKYNKLIITARAQSIWMSVEGCLCLQKHTTRARKTSSIPVSTTCGYCILRFS